MTGDPASVPASSKILMEPVRPSERIDTLDVLRGFALFGILFINVSALVNPADWFSVDWDGIGPVNYAVEVLKLFFVQGKFYSLFAFLFGLGFAVQLARAEKAGRAFAARFLWRVFLLWLIGILHLVFLWDGDILNTYAVAGVILLLFYGAKRGLDWLVRRLGNGRREKSPRWLALPAAALLMFGPLLAFAAFVDHAFDVRDAALAGEALNEFDRNVQEQIQSMEDPGKIAEREAERTAALETFTHGSYMDTVRYRIGKLPDRTLSGPFWFMVAGLFLVGAYFGRNNFIGRAGELRSGFRKLLLASAAIGVPLSLLFVYVGIHHPPQPSLSWWQWSNFFLKTAS
ncbi:MAG TPA: hypothetical protein VF267_01685, partial [Gammaproteobacteria bacterium]